MCLYIKVFLGNSVRLATSSDLLMLRFVVSRVNQANTKSYNRAMFHWLAILIQNHIRIINQWSYLVITRYPYINQNAHF